ncbi:putative Protein FAM107B-like protein, partial [Naja naja]
YHANKASSVGESWHCLTELRAVQASIERTFKDRISETWESPQLPRTVMAEPDYIDEDNPELIKPQKLINPVKTSRNHQDLHRELRMNQKRGLAPQNKPELQKVMERRKRDQLELEKQKIQEEQENAPEFVKVKGNLRRTAQESSEAPNS